MEVKRPVALFLGSYILGIIIAYNTIPTLFKVSIVLIAIFLYMKLFLDRKITIRILSIVAVFFLIGFYRYKIVERTYDRYTENLLSLGKENKLISGKVKSIGKSTNNNYLILENCSSSGISLGNARVYFSDQVECNAKIGNYIELTGGTTTIDAPSNEGEFNQKNYYRSDDIAFIAFAKNINVVNKKYDILRHGIYEIKLNIKSQIEKIFNYKDSGLFTAMVTGDRSRIDKEQKRAFSENGIAHIIAISGLHLSILGLMLFSFMRRFLSVNVAALVVSIFIFLYGIFIDASATSLRAITMLYIRFLSLAIGRTYDSKNTLYIIGFIFLLIHPYLLFNAGFQFSYVAIFALNTDVYIKRKKPIKIPQVIILNLFLFPITLYHYFTYPLYSILLNLVVIPLMPFVLLIGLSGLIVSYLSLPLAILIEKITHIIFYIYDKLCLLIERLPFHILWLGRPNLYELLYYYIALFLIFYAINNLYVVRKLKKNLMIDFEKINDLRKRNNTYAFANVFRLVVSVILLIMSIMIIGIRERSNLRMTFISIGQGDSILVENKDTIMTIDGGSTSNTSNGEYILAPHIKSRGINHIDYAFITHADSDHTNGIMYLLESEDDLIVHNLVLPINARTDTKFSKLKSLATDKNTSILYMKETETISFGDIDIDILSPDEESISNKKMDQNELSLTFRLKYNDHTALFTGDIGKNTMDRMIKDSYAIHLMKSDVLKVPHHGSKNSNVSEFFDIVKPELAVVSYGKGNSYGHPNAETIESLTDIGAYVLKTGENGQIDVYFDKDYIYYKTYK